MIQFLTSLILLLSFSASAQKNDFTFSMPADQEVYRGIDNYIQVNPGSFEGSYQLSCPSCDTIYKSDINTYVVHAGMGRYVELIASSGEDPTTVLQKVMIPCLYLPDPVMYFDISKSGTTVPKTATRIFAKYPPEFHLKASFEVLEWKMFAGGESFSGKGRTLSEEAKSFLITLTKGDGIAIIATVQGPDGIARKIGGAYSL